MSDIEKTDELDEDLEDTDLEADESADVDLDADEESDESEEEAAEEEPKPKKGKGSSTAAKKPVSKSTKKRQAALAEGPGKEAAPFLDNFKVGDLQIIKVAGMKSGKARAMHEALVNSPLVPTTLPVDYLNPKIVSHEFGMNGLRFTIPLGELVQVPEIVAAFIRQTIYARKR